MSSTKKDVIDFVAHIALFSFMGSGIFGFAPGLWVAWAYVCFVGALTLATLVVFLLWGVVSMVFSLDPAYAMAVDKIKEDLASSIKDDDDDAMDNPLDLILNMGIIVGYAATGYHLLAMGMVLAYSFIWFVAWQKKDLTTI